MAASDDSLRWHQLSWLIGVFSMTGRLVPERKPLSLLVIGEPGAGKTANMERFKPENGDHTNSHMAFVTNATTMGLQTILKEKVSRGITHIMVPEFQTLLLKRGGVWETMLGTLLPAMEEGVGDVYVGPKQIAFGGVRLGMIAAMPTDAFFRHQPMLSETGLLSRMMRIRYDRGPGFVQAARHRMNAGDLSELTKIDVALPDTISVKMPLKLATLITDYATGIDAHNVNRETSRFLALTKVTAFLHDHAVADIDDFLALLQCEWLWRNPT